MLLKKSQLKHLSAAILDRFTVAVFVLVSVFGIFICMNIAMPMEHGIKNVHSLNCAFVVDMGEASLCPMSAIEHISSWQLLFTAVMASDLLELLAALFVLAAGSALVTFVLHSTSPPLKVVRLWLYYKRRWGIKLHNYFLHIFARGIIQPRLFA